jgi:hypothetical protein
MIERPLMKFALGTVLSLGALSAFAAEPALASPPVCGAAEVALARERVQDMIRLRDGGQISLVELNIVEGALIDARFCAGEIDQAAYCTEKSKHLKDFLNRYQTATLRGSIPLQIYTQTYQGLAQLAALCSSNAR